MMTEKLNPIVLDQTWKTFKESKAPDCRDKLITHYLHLVKYVVGRLAITLPSPIKMDDMYSTGILGLIKAIEKYDPEKKSKFESYAILLIKGAIIDEMRALDWVPRSVHQKANLISDTQATLEQKLGREASDEEVAKALAMSLKDYEALIDRVRPAIFISLNLNVDNDGDKSLVAERIPDKQAKTSYETADYNEFKQLLEQAVYELPEQERTVLVLYYYESMILKDIGQVLGVSESRASQIHTKAILRLRGRLQSFANEYSNLF
jgi:RNA polymerase sigma factor for flagellar operon FliA